LANISGRYIFGYFDSLSSGQNGLSFKVWLACIFAWHITSRQFNEKSPAVTGWLGRKRAAISVTILGQDQQEPGAITDI
jgi:hypothetical protein